MSQGHIILQVNLYRNRSMYPLHADPQEIGVLFLVGPNVNIDLKWQLYTTDCCSYYSELVVICK